MSMWYGALALSFTLKEIVCPWLTLMSVENPSMFGSPSPTTSHSDCGLPGSKFSATIGFVDGTSLGSKCSKDRRARPLLLFRPPRPPLRVTCANFRQRIECIDGMSPSENEDGRPRRVIAHLVGKRKETI